MSRSWMIGHVCAYALALTIPSFAAAQDFWRHDYNAARQEAKAKNRPLIVDVGADACTWCKKLDATTFRDPQVAKRLAEQFIPVRINADRDPAFAQSLGITSYPTLVFATPDGKILGTHAGYVDSGRFLKQLDRALLESGASGNRPEAVAAIEKPAPAPIAVQPVAAPIAVVPTALALLRADYQAGRFLAALERGKQVAVAGGPDAAEAQRLIDDIKTDPTKARATQDALAESLGEMLLVSAESAMREGRLQDAMVLLERTQQMCPASPHALAAKNHDLKLRSRLNTPVVRMQSP